MTLVGKACLQLTGPATIDVCDNDEQDLDITEGAIELDGVPAGAYAATLLPLDGYELAAEIQPVEVVPDDVRVLQVSLRPVAAEPANGVVYVVITVEDGSAPPADICITISGPTTLTACDNGQGDVEPTAGVMELDTVPEGNYAVEIAVPDGYELAAEGLSLEVQRDTIAQLDVPIRATAVVEPTATEPAVGVLAVQVTLEDGATLVGRSCLTLTGPVSIDVCDNDGQDLDQTEGAIELDAVPAGEYAVQVTTAEGYGLAAPVPAVTVAPSAMTPLFVHVRPTPVENAEPTVAPTTLPTEEPTESPTEIPTEAPIEIPTPLPGTIVVRAVDADGGAAPTGACYTVTGPDGTALTGCDDQGTGEVRFEGVAPGTWTIQQTTPPEGFAQSEDHVIEVVEGEETPVEFANARQATATGALLARAIDQDGNAVTGGCYVAYGPDGALASACDDDRDGVADFGAQPTGEWSVVQVDPPSGHRPAEATEARVAVSPDQPGDAQFVNARLDPAGAVLPPPMPSPDSVSLIGDFQDELGCPADFDPECGASQLIENHGVWTGSLPIPPGAYSLRVLTRSDSVRSLGAGGSPDGGDRRFVVPAGAVTVYVLYDQSTGAIVVTPAFARVQLALPAGVLDMRPLEHGSYELYYDQTAGSQDFQILIDGQAVYQDVINLESDGRVHLVVDSNGVPIVFDAVQPASLAVTRLGGDGNQVPGSCFAVIASDGTLIGQACDVEGTGTTVVAFPNGVAPGDYVVRETASTGDVSPVADKTVALSGGDDAIQLGP